MGGGEVTAVRYRQEFIRKILGKVYQCHTNTLKNLILHSLNGEQQSLSNVTALGGKLESIIL